MSDLDAATGLLRFIANTLSDMVKGVDIESRQLVAIILIVWASAIFSAFVDNIPFTATMVPVMLQVSETSLQETLLWRCRLEIYFANVAWKFMFLWTL
jgi:Na+/H+ antiporter NhaD/arsenite permease-like protein